MVVDSADFYLKPEFQINQDVASYTIKQMTLFFVYFCLFQYMPESKHGLHWPTDPEPEDQNQECQFPNPDRESVPPIPMWLDITTRL